MTKKCQNKYLKKICPNERPKFGHIIDIFWTYLCTLDRFSVSFYKCPNKYHKFGCFLDMMSRVGHFLGMIWTHFGVWSHFWTHYGHIWEFCVQNVSIPTSCSSAVCSNLLCNIFGTSYPDWRVVPTWVHSSAASLYMRHLSKSWYPPHITGLPSENVYLLKLQKAWEWSIKYRMPHHVVLKVVLTSKQQLHFIIHSLY